MKKTLKFFLFGLGISLSFWWMFNFSENTLENFLYAQISAPLNEIPEIKIPPKVEKPKPDLQVKADFSLKVNKNNKENILLANSADLSLPVASLTKLMTALVVFDNSQDYPLARTITVPGEAIKQSEDFGSLKIGDKLSVENLLRIMLIESSNDAAWALSDVIGTDGFVEKMNQKAEALGLKNTHFINPTGLDIDDSIPPSYNFSTVRDLALISKYILNNYPTIFEISSLNSYEILDAENNFHHLAINRNELLNLNSHVIGGKTGYTDTAGGCMILILKDDNGNHIINVILGAVSQQARFEEMKKLVVWVES